MSDIAIEFRIKNKRLKDAILKGGWRSYNHFATTHKISVTRLYELLGMKITACSREGWRPVTIAIATALHCEPEDLWPHEMARAALTTNHGEFSLSMDEAASLTTGRINRLALSQLLEGMNERDTKILTSIARGETLEQAGEELNVSKERARQIYGKALMRLRGRARLKGLKFTDIVEMP